MPTFADLFKVFNKKNLYIKKLMARVTYMA